MNTTRIQGFPSRTVVGVSIVGELTGEEIIAPFTPANFVTMQIVTAACLLMAFLGKMF